MSLRGAQRRSNLPVNEERIMMKLFDALRELIEDLMDLFYCFLRRNEPRIPFDEVIAELKRDGKLPDQ
jgi:hypothetical protein